MATILAHITVSEGCEARFERIARRLYDATHSLEDGVERYEYWRGGKPRQYYALLAFADYRTFIAHQASDHHEEASGELGQVVERIRLEWVDPVQGAAPLHPTRSQRVDETASPLERSHAATFEADVAEWWEPLREV